ncbi:hypothetical protein EQ500_07745, partial [Lactobacillus sp. XV13L]|nr:hypothetical protein [Lactobacillus sp. XV13L]
MRNIPVTYLTLNDDNPLVVKRSDLAKGRVSLHGLWHDLYCQPNNNLTAWVGLSVDQQAEAAVTQPDKAQVIGSNEFGQHEFAVKLSDNDHSPTAVDGTNGTAGLISNGSDNSLGEHTLVFRAHGSVDSAKVKCRLIVVPDDYPYGTQISKDFTINHDSHHYTKAVLSDKKSGEGDLVTVYTHLRNTGDPLHEGQITTKIPEQFQYLGPTSGTIDLQDTQGQTVAAPVAFDGTTLTITLPDPLAKNSDYTLHYDLQQVAPMPLSSPGPNGGAEAFDQVRASSHN